MRAAIAAALLVIVLAAIDLLRIQHDLQDGQSMLRSLDFHTVDEHGGLAPVVRDAAGHLRRADHIAHSSIWLTALAHLPLIGGQIDAVRDMTSAANRVGAIGVVAATKVQSALDGASQAGPGGRVALVDSMSTIARDTRSSLRALRIGAGGWLLPPLASARDELDHHLLQADVDLGNADHTLAELRSFLAGPRRYLVLGGNNAEMRSGGIATTSGVATVNDGAVEMSDFLDSSKTRAAKPGVPLPPGWSTLYGYLDADIEYGNDVGSPNFPLVGQVASSIAGRNRFGPVDGVVYVDTVSLQLLLQAVGPVTVDGVTYDGQNATSLLINQNYLHFTDPDQTERRDAQGKVAKAIFDALETRPVSLLKVAAKLQDLAATRHLMAWSPLAGDQDMWGRFGATGSTHPNDVDVTVQNLGAGKNDYYISPAVDMKVTAARGDRLVDLAITVDNAQRNPTSPYIEGPGTLYAKPGEYGAYVIVFLPKGAYDIVNNDPGITSSTMDGDLEAVSMTYRIPLGQTRTVHVSFALPGAMEQIRVIPSGRVRGSHWHWVGGSFVDWVPTQLDLSRVSVDPHMTEWWLLIGLLLFGAGACVAGDGRARLAAKTATADQQGVRRARIDYEIGWWILIVGVALIAAQGGLLLWG